MKEEEKEIAPEEQSAETEVAVAKPERLTLSREQEAQIYKALAHKSFKQVGMDFGFHFFYDSDPKIRGAVINVVTKIRKAPELWGISADAAEVIEEAIAMRSTVTPSQKAENAIKNESFRDNLEAMRDTVAEMIMKKLAKWNKTDKALEDVSVKDLKDLLVVAIDKSRLLRGESTENITNRSKLDTENMTPQQALDVIMKARDALIENKK